MREKIFLVLICFFAIAITGSSQSVYLLQYNLQKETGKTGSGTISTQSHVLNKTSYSWSSRFETKQRDVLDRHSRRNVMCDA